MSDDHDEDDDEVGAGVERVGDVLDLHTFRPKDVPELIPDYLDECVMRGFTEVRIIHGKGVGTLRRIVHAACERHPMVERYELAEPHAGGWGATLVTLRTNGAK